MKIRRYLAAALAAAAMLLPSAGHAVGESTVPIAQCNLGNATLTYNDYFTGSVELACSTLRVSYSLDFNLIHVSTVQTSKPYVSGRVAMQVDNGDLDPTDPQGVRRYRFVYCTGPSNQETCGTALVGEGYANTLANGLYVMRAHAQVTYLVNGPGGTKTPTTRHAWFDACFLVNGEADATLIAGNCIPE